MLGGGMNSQLAMSAVSQGVMQAQMQDAQEDAMANAMSAINGAQKSNVKARDSLSLQYRLVRVGEEQPLKSSTIVVKAKANGDDVLSPMLETVATDVVGSVASPLGGFGTRCGLGFRELERRHERRWLPQDHVEKEQVSQRQHHEERHHGV
jgi:hypothetical protein